MIDIKNKFHIAGVFIGTAIIVGVVIYFLAFYKRDSFGNFDNTICDKVPVEKDYITSESDQVISSGVVNKYLIDNVYHYIYQFNLPLSTGNDYNQTLGDYNVYLGNEKVGNLKRHGDGFYIFDYQSPIDYKSTQITYTSQSKSTLIYKKAF